MPTMCLACDRLLFADGESTCTAFPAGIPREIISFGVDHRLAFDGDRGVRFMQRDSEEAREAFARWQLVFGSATAQPK
jgi:hypothetical protein